MAVKSLKESVLNWKAARDERGLAGEQAAAEAIRECYAAVKMAEPEVVFAQDPKDARDIVELLGGPQPAVANAVGKFPAIYVNDWLLMNVPAQLLTRMAGEINAAGVDSNFSQFLPPGALLGQWMSRVPVLAEYLDGRVDGQPQSLGWIRRWEQIARGCAYWYPLDGAAVAVPKPSAVHVEATRWGARQLHRVGAPAIEWPTGRGFNVVRGVPLPDWAWDDDVRNAPLIMDQSNMEVRRELVKIHGAERFAVEMGAELVAVDDWGKLWRCAAPDEPGDMLIVEAVNSTPEPDGTFKTYYWRVAPDLAPAGSFMPQRVRGQKLTPLNAIASSFGLTGQEYLERVGVQS